MPSTIFLDDCATKTLHAEADAELAHFVALSVVDEDVTVLHHVPFYKRAQLTEQIGCRQPLWCGSRVIHCRWFAVSDPRR